MSVLFSIFGFIACFVILAATSDWFIDALTSLARRYRIPQSVAGATLAAVGSSAPELFSNIAAVQLQVPNVGIGTITGSAIFNILVIVGLSAFFGKCNVLPRVVSRDGFFYLVALVSLMAFIWDNNILRWEAIALVSLYGVYFYVLVRDIKRHPEDMPAFSDEPMPLLRAFILLPICILIFGVTCHYLIKFTLVLGPVVGLSPVLVGLLANAVGTSIPDTMASIAAVRRGMGSLAISNAVGSNIFDIWFCIGAPLAFRAATPVVGEITVSVPFLFLSFVVALAFIRSGWEVTKKEGIILLLLYGGFVVYSIVNAFA